MNRSIINNFSKGDSHAALAILCGGRASRLGTDKGLFRPLGDESLVKRALRLWGDGFAEILIVVHDQEQATLYRIELQNLLKKNSNTQLRIVTDFEETKDDRPRAALTGVASALAATKADGIIVVPVDQVGVRARHLQSLQRAFKKVRPVCFTDLNNEPLAFPSLWPKTAHEKIATLIEAGALGIKGALSDLNSEVLNAGDAAAALEANINTKEESDACFGTPLFDPFNRRLHYLRFSLTESCNLSCTYCLPDGFSEWYRHKARLDKKEIEVILRGFRRLGFRKVRLTGGEPTVHPRCLDTVRLARDLGFEHIAMTTNGLLLKDLEKWIDAGLDQINISLDALDDERFYAVTKSREVANVRSLVEHAASFTPALTVKINTVLLRSKNGDKENIEQLIDWALGLPITLRFIELMDTKLNSSFARDERILGSEIEPLLLARGLSNLDNPVENDATALGFLDLRGPATDYGSPSAAGRIGLINPLSCNFCSKCNRLRITAQGRLKLCLFGDNDIPLDLSSPAAVALNVQEVIGKKFERHNLESGDVGNVATFRTIGG